MKKHSPSTELSADGLSDVLTFSANGEHLVGGGHAGVRVWRVEDGKEMAMMKAEYVSCLAVSKDARWIGAGTWKGVFIWDAQTFEQVLEVHWNLVTAVDFSRDSTRFVAGWGGGAAIWDVATHQQIQTLDHRGLKAARYSWRQGNQIATASQDSICVWDSEGHLLREVTGVKVASHWNKSLLWFGNHLLVSSDDTIKEFDASTGTVITEWPVPASSNTCIALPDHGKCVAYSTNDTATVWDTSVYVQSCQVQHSREIFSLGFSPDGRFLATSGNGKIIIQDLKVAHLTIPFIDIPGSVLRLWGQDRLTNAEASMADIISDSGQKYHEFAVRSLIRSRLQHPHLATDDANNSIDIQPSVIGYIAKSVALITSEQKDEGIRVFDLVFRYCDRADVDDILLIKAVVLFLAGKYDEAILRLRDLITTLEYDTFCCVVLTYMYLLLGNMQMDTNDYEGAIRSYSHGRTQMRPYAKLRLVSISLISGWKFDDLAITIRQCLCKALYAAGRIQDASECLLELMDTFDGDVRASISLTEWVSGFMHSLLLAHRIDDGGELKKPTQTDLPTVHVALYSPIPRLLNKWVEETLTSLSWKEVLFSANEFVFPRILIYRVICECLEVTDRVTDAVECFQQMNNEFAREMTTPEETKSEFVCDIKDGFSQEVQGTWVLEFKSRCSRKLEVLGDSAMVAEQYDNALSRYSAALSLNPATTCLLTKRSKAYLMSGLSALALNDAHQVMELDPLSPWGDERKYAALLMGGHFEDAVVAFDAMLSKMSHSSDSKVRELQRQYINPRDIRVAIREAIRDAIYDSPRVLIETSSGRLLDKSEQASAFELLPIFNKLILSMATSIHHARIKKHVTEYYRYAMFSHKWEANEPLFDDVIRTVVYALEDSPSNNNLKVFCETARGAGLHWAWSDTCCINKADHIVLQEALVSMFKWYQGSTQTLVLLRGVRSPSRRGDLVKSIWNSRVWTFQEYHASEVVRFYNEDWTLYRNLDILNHKQSLEILEEIEEATGISTKALIALQPGLNDIRKKLCLASGRQTTLLEDEAYSLLGIFSTSLSVVYGDGDQALGKLLSQLLTSSGDTSILAWTGKSGRFNSCLPARIRAFSQPLTDHIPPAITGSAMKTIVSELWNSPLDFALVTNFYDKLDKLRIPSFSGKRMILPCIAFKLGPLNTSHSSGPEQVFSGEVAALGTVEIRTEEDLSRLKTLYLIHPWIDFLLDKRPEGSISEMIPEDGADDRSSTITDDPFLPPRPPTPVSPRPRKAPRPSRFAFRFGGRTEVPPGATPPPPTEQQVRALRALARLTQPFGALLLTPNRGNVSAYRRVAADNVIAAQVKKITPAILEELIDNVRVLDVL